MSRDWLLGKWHELKWKVKEKWGRLTDDDIAHINGNWDQLCSKLQKRYGWAREQAEHEMNHWCASWEQKKGGDSKEWKGGKEGKWEGGRQGWQQSEGHEKKHPGEDDWNKDKKRKAG